MGVFKTRQNKRFSYKPRFYKGEGSPYEMKHKFDEFRTTVGENKSLKQKFSHSLSELKSPDSTGVNKRVLYIVLILIFIFLYIIDFDLSIFRQ